MAGRATRFYIVFGGRERSQWASHEIMLDSDQPSAKVPAGFAPLGSREDPDPLCVGELTTASRSIYGGRNTWPLTRAGMRLVTREHMVSSRERELRERAERGELDARRPHEQPLRLRGNSAQLLMSLLVGLANKSHNLANSKFDSIWATGRFEEGPLGGGFARVNAVAGKLEAFRAHIQEHPRDHHLFVAPYSCYEELRQFVRENDNAVLWEFDDRSDPFPDLSDTHHVLIIALHHGMTHFRALLETCRVDDRQRLPLIELPDEHPRSLERPRLSSPKNQASASARGLTLRWNEVEDASGYQIIVSTQKEELLEINQTNHMASNEIIINELVEETSFTLTGTQLVPYKQYFWAVRARCPGRSGNRSPCWSFVTRPHEELEPPGAKLPFAPTRDITCATPLETQGAGQVYQGQTLVTQKEVINERYELLGELGEGGFARVYRALDKQLGREVAVKILRAEWLTDDKMREAFTSRFKREAQTVANLEHPHIVPIYDSGVVHQNTFERPFLVMKMLAGEDMGSLLSKGPLDARRLLEVGAQTLDALSYVHELGIVHKDLKPDNLFVTTDYRGHEHVYVMDFGIVYDPRDGAPRLTQTGHFAGTVQYLSPEYLLHQSVAPCLDVYQMGLIFIELFTGRPLISRDTTIQKLIGRYIKQEAVALPTFLQGSKAGQVLARAIAFDEQERYPDACAFLETWSNLTAGDFPEGPVPPGQVEKGDGAFNSNAFFPVETDPTRELPDAPRLDKRVNDDVMSAHQLPPGPQRACIPDAATDPINAPDKNPLKNPVLVGLSIFVILGICAASAIILMLVDKQDDSNHQHTTASKKTSPAANTSVTAIHTRPTETAPEHHSTQIAIKSSPSGASVLVDGIKVGETPLEHTHESSKASFDVVVEADGFEVVQRRGEVGKPFTLVIELEPQKTAVTTKKPSKTTFTKKTVKKKKSKSSKENRVKAKGEVKEKKTEVVEGTRETLPNKQTTPTATKPTKEDKERTSIVLPPDY